LHNKGKKLKKCTVSNQIDKEIIENNTSSYSFFSDFGAFKGLAFPPENKQPHDNFNFSFDQNPNRAKHPPREKTRKKKKPKALII
jgi:hypothetical protein